MKEKEFLGYAMTKSLRIKNLKIFAYELYDCEFGEALRVGVRSDCG